jgi:hypothetical protein
VTCRRKMLTWWRSTRISAVLDASDRMRSANQALSWQKIRYTSRNVTHTDHAEPNPTRITPGQPSGRVSGTHKAHPPTSVPGVTSVHVPLLAPLAGVVTGQWDNTNDR